MLYYLIFFKSPPHFNMQMEKGLNDWNYETPSRASPENGNTIGNDLCRPIGKNIPPPGLQVTILKLNADVTHK